MNELIKKLANEAGFIFWQNESWNKKGAMIDWSSIYDEALVRYTQLLLKHVSDNFVPADSADAVRNCCGVVDPEPTKMETIEVDFTDAELLEYMKAAHKLDMTFNQYLQRALQKFEEHIDQENL